jgi:hypothetical protein
MHQSPRAAAVACRKALKASAADCYDFTESDKDEWRSFQSAKPVASASAIASASASADRHAHAHAPTVSSGLRVETTYGSRQSRHSRHVIQY